MKDAAFVMDEFNFWTAALTEKEIKDAIGKLSLNMIESFLFFLFFFYLSNVHPSRLNLSFSYFCVQIMLYLSPHILVVTSLTHQCSKFLFVIKRAFSF